MAAMDDGDLAGKAGQEDGFLDGTVAAAGNVDIEAAEKAGITGSTIGNAMTDQLRFTGNP